MKRLSLSVLVAVFMLVVMLAPVGQKDSVWAESATFYYNRGVEELEKGQYDRAIADYNKALKLNPKSYKAYLGKGVVYSSKGQYDRAIADFNKAIKLNPRYGEAYNNRAVAYYAKKEYDKAWEDVRKAQSLGCKVHPKFLEMLRKASGREK